MTDRDVGDGIEAVGEGAFMKGLLSKKEKDALAELKGETDGKVI